MNLNFIQNGDLLLTHNYLVKPFKVASYLPPIIRFFTDSYWNHSANVVERNGALFVIEADYPVCTCLPLQEWLQKGRKDVLLLRPRKVVQPHYKAVLLESLGVKYDLSALVEQARYHVTGRRNWKGRAEASAHRKYYCSELSAKAHQRPNWWLVWPGHLETDPYFRRVCVLKAK